jgi:hypothetical protein
MRALGHTASSVEKAAEDVNATYKLLTGQVSCNGRVGGRKEEEEREEEKKVKT